MIPIVTDEAAQDAKALFAQMSHQEFKEFLENSIREAGAKTLTITKDATLDDGGNIRNHFTLKFLFQGE